MTDEQYSSYQANSADVIVSEIFSGKLSVAEAIERLRTRLLDLTSRNRLLNFRHPKGRCVQVVDEPSINLVFSRLYVDSKPVPFRYVPEPDPHTYEGRRPDARLHAEKLGISTSFEFAPNSAGANGHRLQRLQTLLYPDDLERQLRRISSEAKTAIEETGTNMLHLVFGFLEFYDSDDSDKPLLAPLISLPATLVRGAIDSDTRTYQYSLTHSGEDIAENQTLREKLRRDFTLSLPDFEDEEEPESYFLRVEQAIRNRRRWRVRRQISLGMLSFGKLAIWSDLDTQRHPDLPENALIKSVFSGSADSEGNGFQSEDYRIDERPEGTQPLIFDADSSQHSAIIDALSGKNMVINGPPGTGKSQTITNVIATALSQGKKVLFVSEKLAALEVVRHRLNQAGLGHFCLELHSHKAQKKKFLEDLQARLAQDFSPPAQFDAKIATLQRQKAELARYAALMGSRVGNKLGMTVNEMFWAAERRRQELGDYSAVVNAIGFPDASGWTYDDIESRRSRLEGLAELYDAIERFDSFHPWWGFQPDALAPSDDQAIARISSRALISARAGSTAADEAVEYFNLEDQPSLEASESIAFVLAHIPDFPAEGNSTLLPRMFAPDSDPKGTRSSRLLSGVAAGVERARSLLKSAATFLLDDRRPTPEDISELRTLTSNRAFQVGLTSAELGAALDRTSALESAANTFALAAKIAAAPYSAATKAASESFVASYNELAAFGLSTVDIRSAQVCARALKNRVILLQTSLETIAEIAERAGLPFDSTPQAISNLAGPNGLPGLMRGVEVDPTSLEEARRLAALPLADRTLADIERLCQSLATETAACSSAFARCRDAAARIGIPFDGTERAITEIATLSKVASQAPMDLLEYRLPSFGTARTAEAIANTRTFLVSERGTRSTLERLFYLDALPSLQDIKSAVISLRRKDGLLAYFDSEWRQARRLYIGLCREKRSLTAKQRAEELSMLTSWIDAKSAFVADPDCTSALGNLFRGLDTDIEKAERLYQWYVRARECLGSCSGLLDKVDLTTLSRDRMLELSVTAAEIQDDALFLERVEASVRSILGADIAGFRDARARCWDDGLECLQRAVDALGAMSSYFGSRAESTLSPRRALRLMNAKAELHEAETDLSHLLRAHLSLREAVGDSFHRLMSLAVGPWSASLPALSQAADRIESMTAHALVFAGPSATLSVAESFAKAKAHLDGVWELVASPPAWNRCETWNQLVDTARQDAIDARQLLTRLATYARPNTAASDVLQAISDEEEARAVLEGFNNSSDVTFLLGDLFQGAATNLEQIAVTHAWGASVLQAAIPTQIRLRLLSVDAESALEMGRRLYLAIATGIREAHASLKELSAFGTFSLTEWHEQSRSNDHVMRPRDIVRRIEAAGAVPGSVLAWSKYLATRQRAREEGLHAFVVALESAKLPSVLLAAAFELSAYQSIGRSVYKAFPELSRFNGATHEKLRADFSALDSEIIALTGKHFAHQISANTRVPQGTRGATAGEFTEAFLLQREMNKQRRHIPIRQLVKRARHALQELKPCFMMGPLSVAQYLEQGTLTFDLVIMDEASQLRPEEALGAVARGTQLVVVGDPKQLPPTSFFDRMLDSVDSEEEDEAPAVTSGMESILDICQQLFTPVRSLRWHYRSQHESLIAFSNHHFYKNLLIFPSPYNRHGGLGVKFRYVRGGLYKDRQNLPEAHCVVDSVLEHMIKRPGESLGVVTLNQTQRELIEELLDKKLKSFPEGANYFFRWDMEGWPFFVKNLENVQGDERDVIFISTTFGKAPGTDKVRQNFGPISRPDGWRRLNVLFTRAKRRIELFTSMTSEDIVVDERTPQGTKALRDYLDFARRGVLVTTDEGEREPDSDFEVSVANVIRSMGYDVKPQLGVAGFFIDMAVRNPDRPGEFLAGIECDGATYHSGFSVRDRDRIRQEILESLGWKGRIHRIWSTDWFYNPRNAIERLRDFLEERRRISQSEPAEDWPEESFIEEESHESEAPAVDHASAEEIAAMNGVDDLFVEVGDRVTYFFVDTPLERHSVLIVDSASNARMGIINEETPLARALLGLSMGDVGLMEVEGHKPRQIQITRIQRQEELLA